MTSVPLPPKAVARSPPHSKASRNVPRVSQASTGECDELRGDGGAARFAVEIERVGPGDDRAFVAEAAEVGERGSQKRCAEAGAAVRACDAGRTEEAEAAVVRVVRGEAGDVAVDLVVEKVVARVRCFESPDAAEFAFDEGEDAVSGFVGNADDVLRDLSRQVC